MAYHRRRSTSSKSTARRSGGDQNLGAKHGRRSARSQSRGGCGTSRDRVSLLQILLHAQHEGVLTYGDIRFGGIRKAAEDDGHPKPGRLTPLVGVHATYANQPPTTRPVYGRDDELATLHGWFADRHPCMVVHGIAGIGKSTLVAHWLHQHMENDPHLSVCWYTCQPWDRALV